MYVPLLQVNRFKKFILPIVQLKYLKSCSRRFYCTNLILRTRLCGTMFITQASCLLDFNLTESVRRKWFVLAVYQFWKGISAGPALKYFTWFIGAGGLKCTRAGPRPAVPKERKNVLVLTARHWKKWNQMEKNKTHSIYFYISFPLFFSSVCISVLQCVAVFCSVLRCVYRKKTVWIYLHLETDRLYYVACLWMCVLFYSSCVCMSAYACVFIIQCPLRECRSIRPAASGLPYDCTEWHHLCAFLM